MASMRQDIEYDGSFEAATTGFTLRGNSNVFHHFYEYVKLFGKTPLHHVTARFSRTDANKVYDTILSEIQRLFPNKKVEVRRTLDYGIYNDPKGTPLEHHISRAEIMLVEDTQTSLYLYRGYGSTCNMEAFVGNDEEYEIFAGIAETLAKNYSQRNDIEANKFFIITHDGQSLDLTEYEINRSKFADFDIERQYNDDFKVVAEHIESTLSKDDGTTGIALLHGCPGSGKTTYLRYLISVLPKRIIYLPPDMANQLGSPQFFSFICQYPNSILIIEDGENILRKRMEGEGTAPAISNLLNMSDGIMGDALNIQVVCTFNADIEEIDDALLRPGRLIANHYFGPLTADKTKALVKHLYGEESEPKKEQMTVAEIYKMNEIHASSEKPKKQRKIGFLP